MNPSTWNIQVEQGAEFSPQVGFYQQDGVTPIDLTGLNVSFRARDAQGSIKLELTTANGGLTVPTPSLGVIQFQAPASDMQALVPGVLFHELVAYDANTPPNVMPIAAGTFLVGIPVNKPWSAT